MIINRTTYYLQEASCGGHGHQAAFLEGNGVDRRGGRSRLCIRYASVLQYYPPQTSNAGFQQTFSTFKTLFQKLFHLPFQKCRRKRKKKEEDIYIYMYVYVYIWRGKRREVICSAVGTREGSRQLSMDGTGRKDLWIG